MIIALGHRAGTGKNTVGEYIYNWLKTDYPELKVGIGSFASPMKDIASVIYSWAGLRDAKYYEKYYQEREVIFPLIGKSPRQIWIEFGNYMRSIYPATWIKFAIQSAQAYDIYIITDARYPNELDAIAQDDARNLKYKITRDNLVKRTDIADCAADGYQDWDGVIENNATIADLYNSMSVIKDRIRRRLNLK